MNGQVLDRKEAERKSLFLPTARKTVCGFSAGKVLSANHAGVAPVLLIDLAKLLFTINVGPVISFHASASQIVAAIAEITGSAALI